MSQLKFLFPCLILFAAWPADAQAQISTPLIKTTWQVQVKKEMWRNGNAYWSTEFESEDEEVAQMVFELMQSALDNGTICEIVGCSFDWIVVDVRLQPKHELAYSFSFWDYSAITSRPWRLLP